MLQVMAGDDAYWPASTVHHHQVPETERSKDAMCTDDRPLLMDGERCAVHQVSQRRGVATALHIRKVKLLAQQKSAEDPVRIDHGEAVVRDSVEVPLQLALGLVAPHGVDGAGHHVAHQHLL